MKINGKKAEIFWDNGNYVAIAEDETGTRRNYAPTNCKTKIDAEIAIREAWDISLTARQEQHQQG